MDISKNYCRGDICWVKFEDTEYNCEQGGTRPVVIISNNKNNRYSPTVIVATITSQQKKEKLPVHVKITTPPEKTGLEKVSTVLCEQIKTIDKERILRKCGSVNAIDTLNIKNALKISLEEY